jgi:WD40 repeat protein
MSGGNNSVSGVGEMRMVFILVAVMMSVSTRNAIASNLNANSIYRIGVSSDGSLYATSGALGLTLYDAEFNRIHFRPYDSPNDYLYINPIFSPDGTKLLIHNEVWDAMTFETLTVLPLENVVEPQWSVGSDMILSWPRTTQIHNAQNGELVQEYSFEQRWSTTNAYFTRVSGDQIFVTDAVTGSETGVYSFPGYNLGWATWNADDTRFAVVSFNTPSTNSGTISQPLNYSLFIVDVPSGRMTQLEDVSSGAFFEWHPDGEVLAGFTNESNVYLWDTMTGSVIATHSVPGNRLIEVLQYTSTGGRLIIGMRENPVQIDFTEATGQASSLFTQTALDGAVQMLVPDPSIERLNAIAAACDAPVSLTQSLTDAVPVMADVIAQVEALPADSIPPACAADLLAVARALEEVES